MTNSLRYLSLALLVAMVAVGCNQQPATPVAASKTAGKPTVDAGSNSTAVKASGSVEHGHKPGAHGGNIVAIGKDAYHAEAVFEKGGAFKLYTLAQDETKVLEVEKQTLTGYVKVEGEGEGESVQVTLDGASQDGDAEGKTSVFVGKLPEGLVGKPVSVTIPSLRIGADRYRIAFTSAVEAHGDDEMPAKVADDEEKTLYLTPGGKYTEADIKANGNVTASQKFKGFVAKHDLKPKVGDKICPVTLTKANPKCAWIVGGKNYEFCCPPCVDEFVKMAKESPDDVKEPEFYVKN